jgi:hypothetical protein
MNQPVLLSGKHVRAKRKVKSIMIDKREGKHTFLIQRARAVLEQAVAVR